jgi:sulfur carrier protein
MTVHVNGSAHEVGDDATLAGVLDVLGLDTAARGVAIALDSQVVPRARWERTPLHPEAHVEIVTAVQGG